MTKINCQISTMDISQLISLIYAFSGSIPVLSGDSYIPVSNDSNTDNNAASIPAQSQVITDSATIAARGSSPWTRGNHNQID